MANARRPQVVAFDVVGTLFALDPLGARLGQANLAEGALGEWFSRFLRDAVALDAVGIYTPFREVARATLEVMLAEQGHAGSPDTAGRILEVLGELPPHPDVAPAFERLRASGMRVIALTNGSREVTERLLRRASLEAFVERVISIDEVGHWKPRREVYLHAADVVGVMPVGLALVAAHAWDVLGAARAGLVTGWVARKERLFHRAMGSPTVQGETLADVAEALLALQP